MDLYMDSDIETCVMDVSTRDLCRRHFFVYKKKSKRMKNDRAISLHVIIHACVIMISIIMHVSSVVS